MSAFAYLSIKYNRKYKRELVDFMKMYYYGCLNPYQAKEKSIWQVDVLFTFTYVHGYVLS